MAPSSSSAFRPRCIGRRGFILQNHDSPEKGFIVTTQVTELYTYQHINKNIRRPISQSKGGRGDHEVARVGIGQQLPTKITGP